MKRTLRGAIGRATSAPLLLAALLLAGLALATPTGGLAAPGEGRLGGPLGGPGPCLGELRAGLAVGRVLDGLAERGELDAAQVATIRQALVETAAAEAEAGRACPMVGALVELAGAVSDLLGLEPREIAERWRGGESLAEIAAAEGVAREELAALFLAAAEERLDAAVAAGRINERERAALATLAEERIERLLDRQAGDGPPWAGPVGEPAADATG